MAATTFTGQEIYSKQLFKKLGPIMAPLSAFSTDFSQEAKAPGEGVSVQLIDADVVGDFDEENNNFERSASENKCITVKFGTAKIVGFNVTPYQVANFNPGWWKEKANVNAGEMADAILTGVCANITAANFSKKVEIASDTDITLAEIKKIKAYCRKNRFRLGRCAMGLTADIYSSLEDAYDARKTGLTTEQTQAALAKACGVEQVFIVPQLPDGLLGFVCAKSALAVAGRNFRPVSDKPYESVREISDPESGIGLTMVELCSGRTGNLHESVTGLFASEVGVSDALVRIVKANG